MNHASHQLSGFDILIFSGLFLAALMVTCFSTSFLIDFFGKRQIVARSDERSMHEKAVPVGGGWSIIVLTLAAWITFYWPIKDLLTIAVLAGAFLLALLSWVDDRWQLPALTRFGVQIGVIGVAVLLLPDNRRVFFEGWPLLMDRFFTALCWLWFLNLFNFMDGIDGLAGIEILFICAGFILIGLSTGIALPLLHIATVLAGATAGFLWWNWQPAKIFLGDVGAISIGFLLGWLLIQLALDGHIIAAILLPSYFIADASITLLKRVFNSEPFWRPHKTHFYQRAAMGLRSHAVIVQKIALANTALCGLAILSITRPVIAAICGTGVLVLILLTLQRHSVK